jgi:hypothetical protein
MGWRIRLVKVCLDTGSIIGGARGKQAGQGLDGAKGCLLQMELLSNPSPACFALHLSHFPANFSWFSLAPPDRNTYKAKGGDILRRSISPILKPSAFAES